MSQLREVRGVATSIRTESIGTKGSVTHVRYHNTDVVSFDAKRVTLRSGGWQTATTKLRMNQAAHQFNLGYHVFQKHHVWFVSYWDHRPEIPFRDGMTIDRVPMEWTGEVWQAAQ